MRFFSFFFCCNHILLVGLFLLSSLPPSLRSFLVALTVLILMVSLLFVLSLSHSLSLYVSICLPTSRYSTLHHYHIMRPYGKKLKKKKKKKMKYQKNNSVKERRNQNLNNRSRNEKKTRTRTTKIQELRRRGEKIGRQIIAWFNPPLSKNITTNMRKKLFLI